MLKVASGIVPVIKSMLECLSGALISFHKSLFSLNRPAGQGVCYK